MFVKLHTSNTPKLEDSLFVIIIDKEKQQMLTFKKLQPGNVLTI